MDCVAKELPCAIVGTASMYQTTARSVSHTPIYVGRPHCRFVCCYKLPQK